MLHEFRCTQTSARMVAKSEDADGADGQDDDADFHDDDDVEGDRGHHHEDFCFRSPRSSNLSPGHSTALAATGRGDSVSLPLRKLRRAEVLGEKGSERFQVDVPFQQCLSGLDRSHQTKLYPQGKLSIRSTQPRTPQSAV